ncbi:hypothetical protein E1A91_A05G020600v1 [Gossypium mustelinum]|uniref:Uncharacterized protein n=1 Tax=Gossypium mustelinum TaxID=34275 RepID=A0A5D2Z188_GOSMU|nr:hypothetical protein E1A91_A05G020600v1 [Gossypium mustelinum]
MAKSSKTDNHPEEKAVEMGHPIPEFLNFIKKLENGSWRTTVPTIKISHFHGFQRHFLHPEHISSNSHSLDSHCMRCSVPFSRNELESTKTKFPRQVLHVPGQIGAYGEQQAL